MIDITDMNDLGWIIDQIEDLCQEGSEIGYSNTFIINDAIQEFI